MLADVAKEVEHRDFAEPLEVVDHHGRGRAGREVEEALELGPDPGGVGGDRVAVEQVPFGRGAGRVADHAGRPADEGDRPAAVTLEVEQTEDRHEVTDVE